MRSLLAMTALTVLAACPAPDPPPLGGLEMAAFFPFDGERTWSYTSTDADVPHRLASAMVGEAGDTDVGRIYEVETVHDCAGSDPGCFAGTVEHVLGWSSDAIAGVHVHSAGGTAFDPPVHVADEEGRVGGVLETTTGGQTYTSTVEAFEACPVAMNVNWEECVRIAITSDGDGAPLAGTWWANAGIGVVAMEPEGSTGRWELSDHVCDGDCDGIW